MGWKCRPAVADLFAMRVSLFACHVDDLFGENIGEESDLQQVLAAKGYFLFDAHAKLTAKSVEVLQR